MKLKQKHIARQSGFTLIELTVVLLVLIGLAGILLPYVGGFAERTHDSANSTSESELASALGRYEAQYMSFPSDMDSLTSGAALINFTMADRQGGAATAANSYGWSLLDLAAGRGAVVCGSLRAAGVTRLKGMDTVANPTATPVVGTTLAANFNPTFNYYVQANDVTIPATGACAGSVVELNDNGAIAQALGWSIDKVNAKRALGHTFLAVGMGSASQAIGRTVQEAPVHFSASGNFNAANAYNRLLVILEVDGNDPATASTCTAMGCTGGGAAVGGLDHTGVMMPARATLAGTTMPMMVMAGKNSSLTNFYSRMQN